MAETYESSSTVVEGNKEEQLNEMALHDKAPQSARFKYLARVTCIHSPALFWARVGDGENRVGNVM